MPEPSRHITGRYRQGMPPPAERPPAGERVQRPGCLLAAGLLLAIGSAAVAALFFLLVLRPAAPAGSNAIWLGIDWGRAAQKDEDVRQLAGLLRAEGIGTVYVWTTWLQADGTWSATTFPTIRAFVDQFRRFYPEARLDAWIGIPAEVPEYRLDDTDLQDTVAAFAAQALSEYAFDAVHLNVEPVWNGDENFLDLLRAVRQAIGDEAVLSIAVPPDWNTGAPGIPVGPYTTTDAHWSQEYKQRVAFLVDELVVMAYNSGLSTPEDYQTWMAFQVTQYLSALESLGIETQLLFGIPTYDAELPGHDPAAESIPAAIEGIRQGLVQSGEAARRFRGLALYAYWSTDALEWETYRRLWLAPDRG
ncbi:MAG: hypothetical protein HPY64_00210 [Anaerolineae bacterium]|nr:hypothetical protein [Anaerolineae bacterium]